MTNTVHIDNRQFYKTLLAIAVPIALQNLVASSFTMVDNIMVGKLGETALASVGLATQLFSVQWMMIFGLCSGCATFYSQFWGMGDVKAIRKVLGFAWSACTVASLVFFLLAQFAPEFVLGLFTDEDIAIELGKGYLQIAAINFLFIAICQPVVAALRATQQTKPPLFITLAAFFVNTCLNYCLIFGNFGFPRLEIRGAAIATVVSRALETVLTLYVLFGRSNPLRGPLADYFKFGKDFALRIARNASATTFNETLWGAGIAAQNAAFGRIGITEYAAYKAAASVSDFFLMSCFAVSNAALVLIGERLGRGEFDYAKKLASKLLRVGLVFASTMALLMFLCKGPLLALFELTPEGVDMATKVLLVIAIMQPLCMHNAFQVTGTMRGGGDAKFAAVIEISTIYLIRVPLAFLGALVLQLPIYGTYALAEVENIIKSVILFARYKTGKWVKNMISGMD